MRKEVNKNMLKCHLCGKEYYHDGKVCHVCEEAVNKGLLSRGGLDTKKWRCDNFLELEGLPFGCNLDYGIEERSIRNGFTHKEKLENEEYDWNLFTAVKYDKIEMNKTKINHFLRFE
jgi:hypothetical protein